MFCTISRLVYQKGDWHHFDMRAFLPLGVIGLFIQCNYAIFNPYHEIGREFLNSAGQLFEIELVFMHSAIFFNMREALAKNRFSYWALTVGLTLVYALFIIEPAKQNPALWANYLLLTLGRITYQPDKVPLWIEKSFGVNLEAYKKTQWIVSLLKMGFYTLLIPLVLFVIPFPDFALSVPVIQELVTVPNSPRDLITLIKIFWLFYFFQSLWEFRFIPKYIFSRN